MAHHTRKRWRLLFTSVHFSTLEQFGFIRRIAPYKVISFVGRLLALLRIASLTWIPSKLLVPEHVEGQLVPSTTIQGHGWSTLVMSVKTYNICLLVLCYIDCNLRNSDLATLSAIIFVVFSKKTTKTIAEENHDQRKVIPTNNFNNE